MAGQNSPADLGTDYLSINVPPPNNQTKKLDLSFNVHLKFPLSKKTARLKLLF